jgi:hypothetical protein
MQHLDSFFRSLELPDPISIRAKVILNLAVKIDMMMYQSDDSFYEIASEMLRVHSGKLTPAPFSLKLPNFLCSLIQRW